MVALPDPFSKRTPVRVDRRGTRFSVPKDEKYLTTFEIARALGVYPETVWRWCIKWFGELPKDGPTRAGVGGGYRIPPPYLLVAKAWSQVRDQEVRDVAREVLVANPKDWVIVVDNVGSTHYSRGEVTERINSVLASDTAINRITVLHVGGLHYE